MAGGRRCARAKLLKRRRFRGLNSLTFASLLLSSFEAMLLSGRTGLDIRDSAPFGALLACLVQDLIELALLLLTGIRQFFAVRHDVLLWPRSFLLRATEQAARNRHAK